MSKEENKSISNSETEVRHKLSTRARKRKRINNSSSSDGEGILPENALEMEKNLHASAIKNNLDDISVKKILKKVVTNDHVLALVKLREEDSESSTEENVHPKLTRSKVKELMRLSPKSAPWNLENLELTPIKHIPIKTRPEVKALIAQELPDDEDDDEYQPAQDEVPSDDDHTIESSSDVDSLPRTPATPKTPGFTSPKVIKDGPFKVPQELITPVRRKLNPDEQATIALRTRSKLSLSATTIEHIENSFVPPDDVPTVDVDDPVWNEFLEECLNPAPTSLVKNEDDEDADPEYNVAADPDAIEDDEEALENSIIKISKKELNDLVTELFSILPETSTEDQLVETLSNDVLGANKRHTNNLLWDGKQEPMSDEEALDKEKIVVKKNSVSYSFIGKTEPNESSNVEVMNENIQNQDPNIENPVLHIKNDILENNESNLIKLNIDKVTASANNKLQLAIIGNKEQITSLSCLSEPNVTVYVEEQVSELRAVSPPPEPPQVLQVTLPEEEVVLVHLSSKPVFLEEQILILQQQLRQHIQLATSNFLQLFVHPIHWKFGPKYKEYLETLHNLAVSKPNSVVNVCNLKPALELITTWEKAVSESTPENTAMVVFIQEQAERSRNRVAQNALYVGEFHDTFKDVVANSPVFLYPYLLPAMPYRPEVVRRFKFLRSEDELIALGLDEFWSYVDMNPDIYPQQRSGCGRTGLRAVIKLLCRHMLPKCAPHSILSHIHYARRNDKDNPIYKYFESRKVEPVKHVLIPFNPKMTLYEQPEYEMPRIWIRHLAKTSKRFRDYLYRRTNVTGMLPRGVDIALGNQVTPIAKKPLPIDFTKAVTNSKPYLCPKIAPKPTEDKVDVYIKNDITNSTEKINDCNDTGDTITVISLSHPICSTAETVHQEVLTNVNSECRLLINETETIENMDVEKQNGVPSVTPEVCSVKQNFHVANQTNDPNSDHCTCCLLLRKICKRRQTLITEYFKRRVLNPIKTCPCKSIKRPKITNKLRLFLKYFKSRSMYVHKDMKLKLAQCNGNGNHYKYANVPIDEVTELEDVGDVSDVAFVTLFKMKLLIRLALVRNRYIKKTLYILMSNFDHETGDPAMLANSLEKVFDVELVDMFKEFLRFLTPDQADRIDKFKDYFTQACASDLVKKISIEVTDMSKRRALLSRLTRSFTDPKSTACGTCSDLLRDMDGHPDLANYTFSLFPHRRSKSQQIVSHNANEMSDIDHMQSNIETGPSGIPNSHLNTQNDDSDHDEDVLTICEDSQTMDYEDHSPSDTDENQKQNFTSFKYRTEENKEFLHNENEKQSEINQFTDIKPVLNRQPEQEFLQKESKTQNSNNENFEMETSDDDASVKSDIPEWHRFEDKLILETLKQSLTREERKITTILDILEEKKVLEMLTDSLTHKSIKDVTERVMYLLELLVLSENK